MKRMTCAIALLYCLNASAESVLSGWSPSSNNISLRIHCSKNLTAAGERSMFWVKCEIRNEGDEKVWVTNRARLYLTDGTGNTRRCLRLGAMSGIAGTEHMSYLRPLAAHQSSAWWESGQLNESGDYSLYAVLDDLGVETPRLPVHISISNVVNDQASRETGLQRAFDSFPVLEPNRGEAEGTYRWVAFTNDPVVLNGEIYHAFRFKAPKDPGVFDWSFIQNLDRGSMSWYIVPQMGTMKGFARIDRTRSGASGVPGLTSPSDETVFQELPAENFKPAADYLMWFKPNHGLPTGVMVSLNFTTGEFVDYRSTPEAVEDKKRFARTESTP